VHCADDPLPAESGPDIGIDKALADPMLDIIFEKVDCPPPPPAVVAPAPVPQSSPYWASYAFYHNASD